MLLKGKKTMNSSINIALKIVASGILFAFGMFTMRIIEKRQKQITPVDRLISLADGFLISRALYVVAELNIADQLRDGEKTAQEIAEKLNLNAEAVHRLLRMLAAHGVFTQSVNNSFALNDVAQLLTTTHPQSLHGFLLHEDDARWQSYGKMAYTLQTGNSTFNHLFGEGYFDYIAHDKKRSEQFDRGMATLSEAENKLIASTFNFSPFNHIVDVGGGVGGFLTAILEKNKKIQGVLYELPHLANLAQEYVTSKGLTNRIQIITGSFLESVVSGGDLYILKRILHDWNDEVCIKILQNCHNAMGDNARLLILDCIVPEGSSYDISKDIDIIMMVIFGGKERTKKDFEKLFEVSGLKLDKITPIPGSMLSAIEAVKVGK